MNIALFGATGFVGNYIIKSLIKNHHTPFALVREGSEKKLRTNINIIPGDLNNVDSINKLVSQVDAVIYNVGIIREFPKKNITYENLHYEKLCEVINTSKINNVKRFLLMSANGIDNNTTGYQSSKLKGERYLKKSGLDWTIFRPSLIYGNPNGGIEFCSQLKRDMISLPIPAPSFYSGLLPTNAGEFKMSPIHVENVSDFFVKSINKKDAIYKTYLLGGSNSFTWNEIIKTISRASKKNKWIIPAPALPIKLLAKVLQKFSWFPITADQITMLLQSNICSSKELFSEFNIEEIPFNENSLSYLIDSE